MKIMFIHLSDLHLKSNASFRKTGEPKKLSVISKSSSLIPNFEFIRSFYSDPQKLSESVLDYFIFPKLFTTKKGVADEDTLKTEDAFWSIVEEKKIVNISGKARSGKTVFLKYIFSRA